MAEFRDQRAILHSDEGQKYFNVYRFQPGKNLAVFIEHYWIVKWQLPEGKIYEQQILSYPAVHLVFEKQNTRIFGVVTNLFTRQQTISPAALLQLCRRLSQMGHPTRTTTGDCQDACGQPEH